MLSTKHRRSIRKGMTATVAFVVTVCAMLILINWVPTIVIDKMFAHDIQIEAILWKDRVINRVSEGKQVFDTKELTEQDEEFLKNITLSSNIYRFSFHIRWQCFLVIQWLGNRSVDHWFFLY